MQGEDAESFFLGRVDVPDRGDELVVGHVGAAYGGDVLVVEQGREGGVLPDRGDVLAEGFIGAGDPEGVTRADPPDLGVADADFDGFVAGGDEVEVGLANVQRVLGGGLTLVWADGGYTGNLVEYCLAALALVLAIVKRTDDMRGFVVLPKRWIVERFFAHLMRSRRLVRDFERSTTSTEAMVYWSATMLMTRRLARPRPSRA